MWLTRLRTLVLLGLILCWPLAWAAAQVEPTAADRDFAATLKALPEDQARASLAAADHARITPGLCRALFRAMNADANRHHDLPKALGVYELAVEAARMGGFTSEEADGLFDVASVLHGLGRLAEASEAYSQSLAVFQRMSAPPEQTTKVYSNWAMTQQRLGNYRAALDTSRKAEEIYRQTGDEVGVARALNNTGLVYRDMGDYRAAMRALGHSLEIATRRHETIGQSYVLNNMAEVALLQGDLDVATSYALRSVKLKETSASKEDLATSLTNLGAIYHQAGKDREAEDALRRALGIVEDAHLKIAEAHALAELGRLDFDRKHYAAALDNLERELKLDEETGERIAQARSLGQISRVHLETGNTAAALEMANRARDLAREIGATPELLVPGYVAGHICRGSQRNADARAALQEAIAATEQIRDSVAGDSGREAFLAEHAAPYREMTALELQEGHPAAALTMSERSKSRELLDLLGGREQPGSLMTQAEAARETRLRGVLASLGAQFRLASSENPPPVTKMRDLRAQLDRANADLAEFRVAFAVAHPELSVRRGDVQPVVWPEARDLAADGTTAILDYAVTPGGTYLFVIRRGHPIAAYRLRAADLSREVREFREKLATRDPEFPAAASRLYLTLLGPARAELAGKSTVVVAPDGDLWQVPFQALRSPEGRYLIEDTAIFYAPSLSVLAALRKSRSAASGKNLTLAAFGNPTGDWSESESEVAKLAVLYGSDASRVWVGPQATEDNFRANAGAYDVVHVAAHGVFDEQHPLRSRLVFHTPQGKDAQDGWLQADEIRELDMHAELLALSGCETGRGNFEEGEGAVGMAWAFLAAGNRAVLASQWRVESTSTTELMARFHTTWRSGTGKAESLRQAALELLHTDRFRHPFYWAGFQVYGDGY